MSSASTQGARNGGITLLGSFGSILLHLLSVILLSRLLQPEDFGLIAMVQVFIALGNLLKDFGIPTVALTKEQLSKQQASNLFWLNCALATLVAGALALSSPLIASFYGEPRLVAIVPVLAAVILISGVGAQIRVDLARKMKVKALVVSDISAQTAGLICAVGMAWWGAGYWALVAQGFVTAVALLLMRWIVSGWSPQRYRKGGGTGILLRSGTEFGLAQFLWFLQGNAMALIVGRLLGAVPLGLFNRGNQLIAVPVARLLDPLTQVVVPLLMREKSLGRNYTDLLARIQFALGYGLVALMAAGVGLADVLIPLALGSGWAQTVPIFKILGVGGCFMALDQIISWAFLVGTSSRSLLQFNLISKPIVLAAIVVGAQFGLVGAAWGYTVGLVVNWPLSLLWLRRDIHFPSASFLWSGLLLLGGGVFSASSAWTVSTFLSSIGSVPQVALGGVLSPVFLGIFLYVVPATRGDILNLLVVMKGFLRRPR